MVMKRWYYTISILAVLPILLGAAGVGDRVRRPIAAGQYYPANPAQLSAAVTQYISGVEPLKLPGPVIGCVVPHTTYRAGGAVMASAFKYFTPGQYDRVIVLSPALQAEFRGCSVPSAQYYRTPLGDVELDGKAIRRLTVNKLIDIRALIYRPEVYDSPYTARHELHEKEPAVEVILPFLQVQLGRFKLVPIVVGDLKKVTGEFDEPALDSIVNTLRAIIDERTLVVACSDFTRYGAIHNYTPFNTDIMQNISRLDMAAIRLVEERRVRGFQAYLKDTKNTITGPEAMCILMRLMPPTSGGVMVGYDTTGRITGNTRASVSSASIVFIDGVRERAARPAPITITDKPRTEAAAPPVENIGPPAENVEVAPPDDAVHPTE